MASLQNYIPCWSINIPSFHFHGYHSDLGHHHFSPISWQYLAFLSLPPPQFILSIEWLTLIIDIPRIYISNSNSAWPIKIHKTCPLSYLFSCISHFSPLLFCPLVFGSTSLLPSPEGLCL